MNNTKILYSLLKTNPPLKETGWDIALLPEQFAWVLQSWLDVHIHILR